MLDGYFRQQSNCTVHLVFVCRPRAMATRAHVTLAEPLSSTFPARNKLVYSFTRSSPDRHRWRLDHNRLRFRPRLCPLRTSLSGREHVHPGAQHQPPTKVKSDAFKPRRLSLPCALSPSFAQIHVSARCHRPQRRPKQRDPYSGTARPARPARIQPASDSVSAAQRSPSETTRTEEQNPAP